MNEIELTQQLVSIDSQGTGSNQEKVDFLSSLFTDFECNITRLDNGGIDVYNLEVIIPGKDRDLQPLIFSGHTDTVPTSGAWTRNPFSADIDRDKLYGLGSTDMLGGISAFCSAILNLEDKPKRDIVLLFDADEEGSSIGGKDFLKTLDYSEMFGMIIAEPTNCGLIAGHKGAMNVVICFTGNAFHSSQTDWKRNEEENAIYKAVKFIDKIKVIEQELNEMDYENFSPPTQSVCKIEGGTALNVIADKCKVTIDRRLLPNENEQEYLKRIISIAKEIDSEAEIDAPFVATGNILNLDGLLFNKAKKINKDINDSDKVEMADYWTEAGLFNKWGDCLVWGPGDINLAHKVDEYCSIKNIKKMKECYFRLIKDI